MTQAFNLSQLANFVNTSGQLDAATGLTNTSSIGFPTGTRMSFNQTAAPTGWTKDTAAAINDSILRLVTGTIGSGGTTAFSTFNAATPSVGATTLSIAQIPSHAHDITLLSGGSGTFPVPLASDTGSSILGNTSVTGGGGSHTHTGGSAPAIKYYDFIVASKN